MNSWDAMKKLVAGKTDLVASACKEDGWTLETPTLYKYQERYGGTFSGAPNCIDRTNRAIAAARKVGNAYDAWSAPLHFLCSQHRHVAVPIPEKNAELSDLQHDLIRCIKEFSDLAQVSSESFEKDGVSKKEAEKIETEGEQCIQQIAAYVAKVKALHKGRG